MAVGIADVDPHRLVPAVGDALQPRIERRPQRGDQIGQRIGEVFVFAAAKAVTAHHDAAAEMRVVGIERGDCAAFLRRQQVLQDRAALRVEVGPDLRPVERVDAGGDAGARNRADGGFGGGFHAPNLGQSDVIRHPISGQSVIVSEAKQSVVPPEELHGFDSSLTLLGMTDAYPLTGNVITS